MREILPFTSSLHFEATGPADMPWLPRTNWVDRFGRWSPIAVKPFLSSVNISIINLPSFLQSFRESMKFSKTKREEQTKLEYRFMRTTICSRFLGPKSWKEETWYFSPENLLLSPTNRARTLLGDGGMGEEDYRLYRRSMWREKLSSDFTIRESANYESSRVSQRGDKFARVKIFSSFCRMDEVTRVS